jgi:Sulfotransferase family
VRRFDEAFATASEARASSQLAAGLVGARHDRSAMERRVAMQREAFPAPEPRAATPHPVQPVFIVGMFRSGSTLLEQILSAHEAVQSGGELPLVPRIAQLLRPYPAVVAGASRTQLDQLANVYLAEVRKIFPDAGVVTDKRPDNFEHVGLIKRMFPSARIIYTHRNPLDICVSTHFLHIDAAVSWASTPEDTAHQIIQCARLMAHWLQLYPDDILTVDYERLLAEPEAQTRAILSFLDLPWSESCMAFHAARTQVRTASVWQVREPLHHRAVGRWRNYAGQLAEAEAMLRAAGQIND